MDGTLSTALFVFPKAYSALSSTLRQTVVLDLRSLGTGGFHTAGLYLDTCLQHIWGFKYKTAGSGKTTVGGLSSIFQNFAPSKVFMMDRGNILTTMKYGRSVESGGLKHKLYQHTHYG